MHISRYTLAVDVTQADIAESGPGTERNPLALALTRALGRPTEVGLLGVWEVDEPARIAVLPDDADRRLVQFVAGGVIESFMFELSVHARRPS